MNLTFHLRFHAAQQYARSGPGIKHRDLFDYDFSDKSAVRTSGGYNRSTSGRGEEGENGKYKLVGQ